MKLPNDKLDKFIKPYILMLNAHGIHTNWSCQGHPTAKYPTGFPKPRSARISGELRQLSDLLKIERLLVGEGCHCATCKNWRIHARVDADACGISEPIRYSYSIYFDTPITEKSLYKAARENRKLAKIIRNEGL
jgi:hypothetical protein